MEARIPGDAGDARFQNCWAKDAYTKTDAGRVSNEARPALRSAFSRRRLHLERSNKIDSCELISPG
ncbi:MAG: hypothetical protein KA750_12730, partial [Thermoflexales bacterium]|nr:hypothetical protein [Thermoflexales bacterium]